MYLYLYLYLYSYLYSCLYLFTLVVEDVVVWEV
jgi:hypothetical protein